MSTFVACEDAQINKKATDTRTLNFQNFESVDQTMKTLHKLSPQEFSNWEKDKGFISFQTVYEEALTKLNATEDGASFKKLLVEYSDVLNVSEDLSVTPKISISLYQKLCNRDGIYRSDKNLFKLVDDKAIVRAAEENYNQLSKVNSSKNLDKDIFHVTYITGNPDKVGTQSRTAEGSCGTNFIETSYFYNQSGCGNDREVRISTRSYVYFIYSVEYVNGVPIGMSYYFPRVEIIVWGRKRRSTCNWTDYATQLTLNNTSFTLNAWARDSEDPYRTYSHAQLFTKTVDNTTTPGDYFTLVSTTDVGDYLRNEGFLISSFNFLDIHAEASSRGTNNNFAVVDCH